MGPAYILQIASCTAAFLSSICGLSMWVARGYGISIAELHQRMPVWLVPTLTLVLVVWTTILAVMI